MNKSNYVYKKAIKNILDIPYLYQRIHYNFNRYIKSGILNHSAKYLPTFTFKPLMIMIVINNVCNLKCKMCDIGQQKNGHILKNIAGDKEISYSILKKIVDESKSFRPEIFFCATEPLLYPNIIQIIEYTVHNGLLCSMTTNGILLGKYAQELVEAGIHQITVSVDGYNSETNDHIRGVKGAFERTVRGIEKIDEYKKRTNRKNYPNIDVNCTVTNLNYQYLEKNVKFWQHMPINKLSFSHQQFISSEMQHIHNSEFTNFCVSDSSVDITDPTNIDTVKVSRGIKKIKSDYADYDIHFFPELNDKEIKNYYATSIKPLHDFYFCYYPWKVMQIMPNNLVKIAFRCFENTTVGNIEKEKLLDIWYGKKLNQFRKLLHKHNGFLPACLRCSGLTCGKDY